MRRALLMPFLVLGLVACAESRVHEQVGGAGAQPASGGRSGQAGQAGQAASGATDTGGHGGELEEDAAEPPASGGSGSADAEVTDSNSASSAECQSSDTSGWPCAAMLDEPCPVVFLDLQGQPFDGAAGPVSTLEDARCILRALRDRTPSALNFITEYSAGSGLNTISTTTYAYALLESGTVVTSYNHSYDLLVEQSFWHAQPKPTAFFDTCLTHDFGPELFACLTQVTTGETPSACPVCPEPVDVECHYSATEQWPIAGSGEEPDCGLGLMEAKCQPIYLSVEGQPFSEEDRWSFPASSLEDVRCVLAALRDRTPTRLRFTTEHAGAVFVELAGTEHDYYVLDDESVVRSTRVYEDLGSSRSYNHHRLKPPEFFEGCMQLDFGPELYGCLNDYYEHEIPSACPVCPAP